MIHDRDAVGTRLLILGASARAAAFSAVRAGFTPICCDLFGDCDLRAIAGTHRVSDYPAELSRVAERVEPADWIYTGALENSPRLIAEVSERHRLLGNPPDVLRAVRDPFCVHEILRESRVSVPDVRRLDSPPDTGDWLLKPVRGGGGNGIREWTPGTARAGRRGGWFLQRRIRGTPVSAVFIASRVSCRLVEVTRQLVGEAELHAIPFAYCGSIGPLRLPDTLNQQIDRIGRVLAVECGLRGLFGVDCIVERETVWPIEVNPRYTASVEVLEFATREPLLGMHRSACRTFLEPDAASPLEAELHHRFSEVRADSRDVVAKAILFADREVTNPSLTQGEPRGVSPQSLPDIADIPSADAHITAGDPICTVFAAGSTVMEALNRLFERVREVDSGF